MTKVLIIDDDPDIRAAYVQICKKQGWEVLTAGEGGEGLKVAKTEYPDVILLDVLMPGMGGIDFLEEFKKDGSELPITIVLTNSQVPGDTQVRARQLGASHYQVKSELNPNDLANAIKSYLNKKTG